MFKNAFDKYRLEGKDVQTAYDLAQKDYDVAQKQGVTIPKPEKPSNDGFKEYVRREKELEQEIAQRDAWNRYLDDIERQTGRKIPTEQREMVIYEGMNGSHPRLLDTEHEAHRKAFNSAKRRLRKQWELITGQKWPTDSRGYKYDAHEIIPNSFNSPLEWWNIHPARYPDEHQGGIHRSGAPFYKIFTC